MNRLALAILVLAPAVAAASTADQFGMETYLLPVFTRGLTVPGAHGSQWKAELTLHNASDRFVDLGPCNVPSPNPCPPQIFGFPPGTTRVDPTIGFTDAGDRGRLSYVRREVAHLLDMKLRLADVSRHALNAGTEIPVIRSGDFHTSTLRLLNVPLTAEGRVMLRIFDVDDAGDAASVEIRIHSLSGSLLHSETRTFTASGYAPADGLPFAPSYIEMHLDSRPEHVRIDIIPITSGLRFWAYASVTNNATQHVTLVTPP